MIPTFATDVLSIGGGVSATNPPHTEAGSLLLRLDPVGRLTHLHARPLDRVQTAATPGAPEWSGLFKAAGLDVARFTSAPPERVPPMATDSQYAWTGSYGDDGTGAVRVEAGSYQGRPVFFEVGRPAVLVQSLAPQFAWVLVAVLSILIGCLIATAIVALRNAKLGRSDRRGALGLAGFVFATAMLQWGVEANHVAGAAEMALLLGALRQAAFWAGLIWLFYVAIEPYVRRNWPESLISWTRFHRGQFRDPLVASHILVGVTAGLVFERVVLLGGWAFLSSTLFGTNLGGELAPMPANLGLVVAALRTALFLGTFLLIFVVFIRLVTRRLWVANVAGGLVFSLLGIGLVGPIAGPSILFAACLSWLWMLQRLGLLPVLVTFSMFVTRFIPMVLDGWLVTRSITLHAIPLVIAAVALWAVLAGRTKLATASRPATEGAGS
jgi:hypothetical protein